VGTSEEIVALLDEVAAACATAGRDDLADRVAARRERLVAPRVCVVVAGEFKAGKSSLVNALVGADVCPVDDDVATAVPTLLRFAPEPAVWARRAEGNGAGPEPLDRLAAYVREEENPDNREAVRIVEVGLPSPLLREGLALVDTPGVGGLGSSYASATMTALAMAHAVVFVSDASQEYTRPELDFLETARAVCPEVVPVLTKVDIVPDWKRVHELNEGWLGRAGVGAGLVATSAALGRRRDRLDLREESGLDAVVARLDEVSDRARDAMAAGAAAEAGAVIAQLAAPLRAERDALADPDRLLGMLSDREARARALTADAEWSAALDDGIIDLEAEVGREVGRRMKAVLAEAVATVRGTDPATGWQDFEAALTRQVSAEVSAVAVRVTEAANALAAGLARDFAEEEAAVAPTVLAPAAPELVEGHAVARAGATRWRGVLVDAGWGGLEALGVMGSILTFTSISLFNPFSLVIGVFIGGKSLRDSRRRELERRRDQAVEAVTQYVQDAVEAADREFAATTRRIRRELRTTYQRRAEALHRSAREALSAAERTIGADPASRQARRSTVEARLAALEALERRAADL
jgi:hypothetical protein